jgi:hypothetical protein
VRGLMCVKEFFCFDRSRRLRQEEVSILRECVWWLILLLFHCCRTPTSRSAP